MTILYITIGVVLCVAIWSYSSYKEQELEFKKAESENAGKTLQERTLLEVEKEKTAQRNLEYKKEAERTKQLEMKVAYEKETGNRLYSY